MQRRSRPHVVAVLALHVFSSRAPQSGVGSAAANAGATVTTSTPAPAIAALTLKKFNLNVL